MSIEIIPTLLLTFTGWNFCFCTHVIGFVDEKKKKDVIPATRSVVPETLLFTVYCLKSRQLGTCKINDACGTTVCAGKRRTIVCRTTKLIVSSVSYNFVKPRKA